MDTLLEAAGVCTPPAHPHGVFPLYVAAAIQSAHLRVCRAIYRDLFGSGSYRDARLRGYYSALADTRKAVVVLGRHCRKIGSDPRQHALFDALELRNELVALYEHGRRIDTAELTPALIHAVGEKGWRVHYCGWTILRGKFTDMDDHYGQPTVGFPLKIMGPSGQKHRLEMPGLPIARAREAFMMITGHAYDSDDGLGQDPQHLAERCA